MAILITTENKVSIVKSSNKSFSLSELQEFVGGWIEIIDLGSGKLLVVNEEGKLMKLAENKIATIFARDFISYGDSIVGNAILADRGEI